MTQPTITSGYTELWFKQLWLISYLHVEIQKAGFGLPIFCCPWCRALPFLFLLTENSHWCCSAPKHKDQNVNGIQVSYCTRCALLMRHGLSVVKEANVSAAEVTGAILGAQRWFLAVRALQGSLVQSPVESAIGFVFQKSKGWVYGQDLWRTCFALIHPRSVSIASKQAGHTLCGAFRSWRCSRSH